MIREQVRNGASGLRVLLGLPVVMAGTVWLFATGVGLLEAGNEIAGGLLMLTAVVLAVVQFFVLIGLFVVQPNEGRVLQLFGKYVGTANRPGLQWANPFYTKKRISQRTRSFESAHLKVNDKDGNPIEIGAVVV